ncbi:COG1361 S-layer family protein [Methanolobus sp. ZRKC2]|uniref:COG1361 S-layer family protein n=1 Tax=Methanolobus sp. ZRKC2 TaxID=3125783 RepID=UPI00324A2BCA
MVEKNDYGRKILGSLFCIGLLFSAFVAPASAASAGNLKVDVIDYDPYPAEIGEYVDVTVKIENVGYGRADAVSIRMDPEYPFSLDSEKNAIKEIGILSPDDAAVKEYRLFVDENARFGTGSIDIYYQTDSGDTWFKKTFDLKVGSASFDSKGTIQLESTISDPEVFMPGDKGTVSFTLTNTATASSVTIDGEDYDTNARVQSAMLTSSEGIEVTSSAFEGSGVIGPGDSISLSYNVDISDDIEDGTYYLELSMVGNSHAYNSNWRIPVKVDSSAIKVIPSKPLILTNGEGTFEFDVANMHPNTLSSVSVRLVSDELDFSPEEYYIGSMDPDELFTIEIKAKGDAEATSYPVSIEAEYRNGINEHMTEVGSRNVELITENEGNNGTVAAVLVIAIVIGLPAVVLYRRRKQNK